MSRGFPGLDEAAERFYLEHHHAPHFAWMEPGGCVVGDVPPDADGWCGVYLDLRAPPSPPTDAERIAQLESDVLVLVEVCRRLTGQKLVPADGPFTSDILDGIQKEQP